MHFQIEFRVMGAITPPQWGGGMMRNFLSVDGNLRSDFDYSNFFSKLKETFCKY